MKKLVVTIACFFIWSLSLGQVVIKGAVRNTKGEGLPFCTVYVKGTTNGTTSNGTANYFIKVKPGKQTIVAQYVGYQALEKEVNIISNETIELDFELKEQALQLKTVVITSDEEDPAYRVIREAIRRRKFYQNQVKAFKTNTYLKGLQRLDKRPNRLLGIPVDVDTGIVYLSESISEFSFEHPNKVKEVMISSKVSGDDQGFSFNQASDFNFNAYQKSFDLQVSEREFVSPISKQAFLFYDYQWLGTFEENEKLINKIKLIPKRATDPVFEGVIYIVEDEWKIHTIDMLVTKKRGLEFIDSLRINQVMAPVVADIWMPISQRFSFKFGILGFRGSGYFVGVYSNYKVEPNYEIYEEAQMSEIVEEEEPKDLFQEEDFTAEVLYVEEGSNERDSTYWENIRPMPLTSTEIRDYHVKDSIRVLKESPAYKDSIDRKNNKVSIGNVLLSGYTHQNSIKEKYWQIPPIQGLLQFNTVEGAVVEFDPSIWKRNNEQTVYWVRPSIRYGFSSEDLYAKVEASYRMLDEKFTRFYVGGGEYVAQFDETEAISPLANTYATLWGGDNYMKLFKKSFGYVRMQQELVNGILMDGEVEYAKRDTLSNTELNYYWAKTKDVDFTPNLPYSEELNGGVDGLLGTGFETNHSLTVDVNFRIRFGQRYATRPDQKLIYTSKYPELSVRYKRALGDVNYDLLSLRVYDNISFGLTGVSNYIIETGTFLQKNEMTFVDYKHFSGNQIALSEPGVPNQYGLLPFYDFSTNDAYLEVHYEHHFNEFIFNKIPLIKKLNWQAVSSVNFLTTNTVGNYVEIGAGIEHIFKVLRVDYFWGFRNGQFFDNGYRIGFGF